MENRFLNKRFERAVDALRRYDIDAWVICGKETNVLGEPAFLFLMPVEVSGRTTVIVTKGGERICIGSRMEMEEWDASGLFTETITYPDLPGYEAAITDAVRKRLPMHRIAINAFTSDPSADGLSHSDFLMLTRCFAEAGFDGELAPSARIMKQVRGRKSDEEVEGIRRAVLEAMKVYDEARPLMRVGMSGMDVQRLFQGIVDRKGYGYSWHKPGNPYVSVGARSSYLCMRPPEDVYIQPGDLVNVDLGIRVNEFASDDQRSFYALRPGETEPPEEVRRAFTTIQRINAEVCRAMRTGFESDELTPIGDRVMIECGYPEGYKGGFGHEVHLFAHQGGISAGKGLCRPEVDSILEENMTFTLEPSILTSHGRLCQEEVVRVTENGGEMLSIPQKEVWIIQA